MRWRKIMNKVKDAVLNPEETVKLNKWKKKLENARSAYAEDTSSMRRREELYEGSRKVNGNPNSNKGATKVAVNVRNITYELIESQVDSSIPAPKVIPIHEGDEEAAKMIETFLTNKAKSLDLNEINDIDERVTYIQGGDFFHVEWDSKKGLHSTLGDLSISERHPRQVIPQPGVTDISKMDYIFIQFEQTKDFIKAKYGKNVADAEKDPTFDESENKSLADDVVTVNTVYYRNGHDGIGLFTWCDDYILEDLEDYQARLVERCVKCGEIKTNDVCPTCGSKKFHKVKEEYETITDVIKTFSGIEIPNSYEEQGLDENGQETTEVIQTQIPYYNPKCIPIVLRKNVSRVSKFLGFSDVDIIEDQQDAVNKIGSKIQEKILMGGSYLMLPKGSEIETSDKEYKIVRVDQATKNLVDVKTTQAEISQDITMLNMNYNFAKSTIGVTDAYQGKYDSSATSGTAKQYSINQAAGRLESKRVMKNEAYAKLYEMMFKFALAYADQKIPISQENVQGQKEFLLFDRYAFLKQDDAGEYYWNDEFIFTTDPTSTIMTNREAMWNQIDMKLQSGAFGTIGDLQTALLYWTLMEKNHYPNAADIKARIEQRMAEQAQTMPQIPQGGEEDVMSIMQSGNGVV